MFERFTGAARDVIVLAQEAAREHRYGWIGTEHLLVGLTRVGGPHCHALNDNGLTEEAAVAALEQQAGEEAGRGNMPFTPEAKQALENALRQAMALKHRHIGPSHLGLALLEGPGLAGEIISTTADDATELRRQLTASARGEMHADAIGTPPPTGTDDGDVLLALYDQEDSVTGRALRDLGIERGALEEALRRSR